MDDLRHALDDLAWTVAATQETSPGRPALDAVVRDLERMAGAPLDGDDPLPVLHRRFGRVHRLLLQQSPDAVTVARIRHHRAVLEDPVPALVGVWREWLGDVARPGVPVPC